MKLNQKAAKNFGFWELLPPRFMLSPMEDHIIEPEIIDVLQFLRVKLGKPIVVNNWYPVAKQMNDQGISLDDIIKKIMGDDSIRKWSGLRPEDCPIGAEKSAHKLGKAVDPKGDQWEMFGIIRDNAKDFYGLGLRRVEDPKLTQGWLHMDTLDTGCEEYIKIIDHQGVVGAIMMDGEVVLGENLKDREGNV